MKYSHTKTGVNTLFPLTSPRTSLEGQTRLEDGPPALNFVKMVTVCVKGNGW